MSMTVKSRTVTQVKKTGQWKVTIRTVDDEKQELSYATEEEARAYANTLTVQPREKKEVPKLPEGFKLGAAQTVKTSEELKKRTPGGHRDTAPRDAHQKQVDKDVAASYAAFKSTGKPRKGQYIVPKGAEDAVVAMLRRATGTGGLEDVRGKLVRHRIGTHESGNALVQFWTVDKGTPAEK